jgi:hypothetical protein
MLKALRTAAAAAALLTAGVPLLAHHAFSAEYDAAKPVTLHGSISRLEWNNPHVTFFLEVATADGKTESWRIEAGAPNQLARNKVTREMLAAGTTITLGGFGAKDSRKAAWGRDVTFADGAMHMLVVARDDPTNEKFRERVQPVAPASFADRVGQMLPYGLYVVPGLILAIGLWMLRRQKKKEGVSTP